MFDRLVSVRGQLTELVTGLDPDALSGVTARGWFAELDRVERLAAAGKTLLARRLADTHRPQTVGAKTAAEELARRAGTSTGAAKDTVSTSHRLPDQQKVDGALRRGELSAAQAALVSAAAAANPAEEDRLVELAARVSVPELREECARVRAAADPNPDARNRRLHAGRQLRRWTDPEGFWNLHAKGTPQAGAAFNTILDAVTDHIFRQAHRSGCREPLPAYAFDALMALADHTADRAADTDQPGTGRGRAAGQDPGQPEQDFGAAAPGVGSPGTSGENRSSPEHGNPTAGETPTDRPRLIVPGPSGRVGTDDTNNGSCLIIPGREAARHREPPPAQTPIAVPGRFNPRYRALLRVDVEALRRGRVDGDELCEIRGVGPIPVPVAEGLLGQAILHLVITRGSDVVNVTHLGRGPTAAQRIALAWAQPSCTVEGCWRTRTENDHREPWAQTRHTRLDELDPLCPFHHDLKTRHGWALVAGSGKRAFVPPDDPRHPSQRQSVRATGTSPDRPPNQDDPAFAPGQATRTKNGRGSRRRRAAAAAQTTLPDPPGDPPQAA
jgi:hypothetical protein